MVLLFTILPACWSRTSAAASSVSACSPCARTSGAAAAGINVRNVKLVAFAIGSFIAGLGER